MISNPLVVQTGGFLSIAGAPAGRCQLKLTGAPRRAGCDFIFPA